MSWQFIMFTIKTLFIFSRLWNEDVQVQHHHHGNHDDHQGGGTGARRALPGKRDVIHRWRQQRQDQLPGRCGAPPGYGPDRGGYHGDLGCHGVQETRGAGWHAEGCGEDEQLRCRLRFPGFWNIYISNQYIQTKIYFF